MQEGSSRPAQGRRRRALVVEDTVEIQDLVTGLLREEGFEVRTSVDGEGAIDVARAYEPDLVVLDLNLPGMDGVQVCQRLRAFSDAFVLMLTAKSDEIDKVVGLEVGADDYITKPYSLRELVARMRAVLRRAPRQDDGPGDLGVLEVGDVRLDPDRHEVTVRGEEITLPLKEFDLLELLLFNAGRVMTRETLIDRIWGPNYVGDTKTLDVHIKRLRSKVEDDPSRPRRIVTIRGLGYRYESDS